MTFARGEYELHYTPVEAPLDHRQADAQEASWGIPWAPCGRTLLYIYIYIYIHMSAVQRRFALLRGSRTRILQTRVFITMLGILSSHAPLVIPCFSCHPVPFLSFHASRIV